MMDTIGYLIAGIIGAIVLGCFFVLCYNVAMIRKGIKLVIKEMRSNTPVTVKEIPITGTIGRHDYYIAQKIKESSIAKQTKNPFADAKSFDQDISGWDVKGTTKKGKGKK